MPKPVAALAVVCLLAAAAGAQAQTPPVPAPTVPPTKTVRLLATGGTIAGAGQGPGASYRAGVVPIGDILRAVPGLGDVANVTAEQIANVGSYDVDETIWRKLLDRIQVALSDPQVSGVIITHGTDTLEETAYFLSLATPSTKPVVVVGSMRPGTAVSADGPQNLLDAVRVATADDARNRGAMVVMNDTIFDPRSVTKFDVRRVNAFAAPSRGPIGDVLTERPRFFAQAEPHDAALPVKGDTLPRVAIAYGYAGVRAEDIRAAASGARALVIAGVGAGSLSAGARQAVKELTAAGIPVVRTARQGVGDIWYNPAATGDLSDDALGTIAGRELTPAKARILLMLALQTPRSRNDLQALFDRYGVAGP